MKLTDLEKLYTDNFKGLISNAKYNEIVIVYLLL